MGKKKKLIVAAGVAAAVILVVCVFTVIWIKTHKSVITSANMMEGITANRIEVNSEQTDNAKEGVRNFSTDFFKEVSNSEDNVFVSPLSAMMVLGTLGNGAQNDTLTQMEDAFGMDISDMNNFALSYLKSCDESDTVASYNSLWINKDFADNVKKDFLQKNADYYRADVFKTTFPNPAVKDINIWVNEKTKGLIEKLDNLKNLVDESTYMAIINTIMFESEWKEQYDEEDTYENDFYNEDGEKERVEFMCSTEYNYLKDSNACGFYKEYSDNRHIFVALLPDEDVSLTEYIDSLTGEKIKNILDNSTGNEVKTEIPKFTFSGDVDIKDVLISLVITDLFDSGEADLPGIGGESFVHYIRQQTYISIDEKKTSAAAVTYALLDGASFGSHSLKVILNRPFVYMIYDKEYDIPVFMGTIRNM